MDICVIGAGYVGLVTSACLAYLGNHVTAVEASSERLGSLKKGIVPFFEPGLQEFVKETIESGFLTFTDSLEGAVKKADVIFIAVGTPSLPNGEPDLSQVMVVARAIGGALDGSKRRIIVNKSTVPVGSGNWVEMLVSQGVQNAQPVPARSARPESPSFTVVSNPEFLREGSAITDSFYPDRIVVGASDDNAVDVMKNLYKPIINQTFEPPSFAPRPAAFQTVPFVVTDLASAELIKYSANAFLAMKISFANEIAGLCEKVGADVRQVAQGIGLDYRIGKAFLNAGVGWGGSCFGKDVSALMQVAKEYSYPTSLLEATVSVNERQRLVVIKKLQEELKILKGRTVGLLGLSFKPDTDDLRDAPAITIAYQLLKMGASVKAFDPVANERCEQLHPNLEITYCDSALTLAQDCDAVVLVTEWALFRNLDWKGLSKVMRWPLVIDGRNVLSEQDVVDAGMTYRGIGH
ncbi:MAG: UDP-glucose/GDP-mannose dehydrogenase family protein [Candidatus Obscuribacter sp.]|nr:UDP-glucose/GDP-mannose dehydrogenase family protein [Candidatus Melainabacteria bacterium]MBK8220754.1 UDP-glucose/GDP-mannose dehydrogenase family protein [Candidatus Obscuribacter sp.]MBK9279344.1 UDP-glucose/GDP-mannose dehydrogenase family protein [Candidatus Obscuribacter sp.]MBL8083101.1 UDP-glucose/GDP-mannose dehydrogenase family protein [Candidatus Obscuribacter sp.]MDX1989069.1 UDP-glucose/GDP-mannose dehydrogenase family protein [Candidatus Obscuribacter sp.]